MRILIVGGHGFIGSHLTTALLDDGHEVYVYGNRLVEPSKNPDKRAYSMQGDIRDLSVLKPAVERAKPEVIYHFAAVQGYTADPTLFMDINVTGTWKLFQAIESWREWRTLRQFILASSESVYRPSSRRVESDPQDPPSVYGLSKVFQEQSAQHKCDELGISLSAMRYSIVLGPGQSLQSTESGILRNWYHAWKQKIPAEIYGDGTQERGFVHVEDVTSANVAALSWEGLAYNVCAVHASVNEVAAVFKEITGCEFEVLGRDIRPGGEYTLWSESSKARYCLGWKPKRGLREMVEDFISSAENKSSKYAKA